MTIFNNPILSPSLMGPACDARRHAKSSSFKADITGKTRSVETYAIRVAAVRQIIANSHLRAELVKKVRAKQARPQIRMGMAGIDSWYYDATWSVLGRSTH